MLWRVTEVLERAGHVRTRVYHVAAPDHQTALTTIPHLTGRVTARRVRGNYALHVSNEVDYPLPDFTKELTELRAMTE